MLPLPFLGLQRCDPDGGGGWEFDPELLFPLPCWLDEGLLTPPLGEGEGDGAGALLFAGGEEGGDGDGEGEGEEFPPFPPLPCGWLLPCGGLLTLLLPLGGLLGIGEGEGWLLAGVFAGVFAGVELELELLLGGVELELLPGELLLFPPFPKMPF